ncbi:TlpA family protein disulfide reductase [sulfur-oxidizing endosymbiont of Gigantopelta aegis]|uniref:TlpA family protein disulfide reductase n=1 Tax=sulfur-oxidizing endosymbiont of Gigantopelta aegis TaxID=2794934 RepID=UPI0018DBE7F4|nr:TlpA disulfide reductase family protein [sulfur-oxidizing endosymbiont of Gigantopelta aegis]
MKETRTSVPRLKKGDVESNFVSSYLSIKKSRQCLLFISFLFFTTMALAKEIVVSIPSLTEELSEALADEVEITLETFPASGNYLILWLAPEYGLRPSHLRLAQALAKQNIEVWQTDISESLFMPQGLQSSKKHNGAITAALIEYAHQSTGKKIILAGDSYAAITVLRGVNQWQKKQAKDAYLIGAILFSPNLYAYIPALGLAPEYMPVVAATNIPIMIYQATKNGNIGQFDTLLAQLQTNNNPVYSKYLPNVMALFYAEEPTPPIKKQLNLLPLNIKKILPLLQRHELPLNAIPIKTMQSNQRDIDRSLKTYSGKVTPLKIHLNDVYGKAIIKNNYQGKITIVNFWATWCPPCVEEIPSLNRLKVQMTGLPFELISINYAEEKDTVLEFLKKINVEFPVLLDPNGEFAKQWQVITFPSTFIIDPQGKIRYGVNAAIEWDDPKVIEALKSLL